ncbi:MAG: RagB/SusD family nutrient uptake outer membrane protein, partial [Prevotella sp.]|nr:RagB/SusD family nutrient uptake outer membrane protein [Prevotella sp.]
KDYRSLWQYSNSLVWDEAHDGENHAYAFIADMDRSLCFDQPGMGNGNTEELFQIQFMNASKWNINSADPIYSTARMYCNYLSVFWSLRINGNNGDRDYTYPFTNGWGQGSPSCNIWDDWTIAENNGGYKDIRKLGSLIDGVSDNPEIDYDYVKDCTEASGLGVKKYNGVTVDALTGDSPWWDKAPGWSSSSLDNPMQGDHFEDFYLMRYADVLLMATELTGDASYMKQVQRRAGVPETEYSLRAVQDERRWEFAFEGLRFNDMRRWTGKGTKDGYATKALEAQRGKQMVCLGDKANKRTMEHMTCSWKERYEATDGFLAKPQAQITLMNGNLEQNPGWDAADAKTQYKTLY